MKNEIKNKIMKNKFFILDQGFSFSGFFDYLFYSFNKFHQDL